MGRKDILEFLEAGGVVVIENFERQGRNFPGEDQIFLGQARWNSMAKQK